MLISGYSDSLASNGYYMNFIDNAKNKDIIVEFDNELPVDIIFLKDMRILVINPVRLKKYDVLEEVMENI